MSITDTIKSMFRDAPDAVVEMAKEGSPFSEDKPQTDSDLRKRYRNPYPSISDKLPWLDLVGDNYESVLLDDAVSVGAAYRIKPASVEGRSAEYVAGARDAIKSALNNALPKNHVGKNPWVVAFYAKRERNTFKKHINRIREYAKEKTNGREHPFTDHYIDNVLAPHLMDATNPNGLFIDNLTDRPWGAVDWEIIVTIHKRQSRVQKKQRRTPEQELENIGKQFTQALRNANIIASRMSGREIRAWLARWLNPAPKETNGDVEAFIDGLPAFEHEDRPFDWSLSDDVASRDIKTENNFWYFDSKPHTIISVSRLRSAPVIGQTTAERQLNQSGESRKADQIDCMFDKLPLGATLIITFSPIDQTQVTALLDKRDAQSKGDSAEAIKAQETIAETRREIVDGNYTYPVDMAIALQADNEEELELQIDAIDTLMTTNNFEIIDPEHDLYRLDSYLRRLPFAYDPSLKQITNRQDMMYTQHLANILPLYGRATGTGRPGLTYFNRGGEFFGVDPLHFGDRTKNAHLFLFGPTGAGKSANLVYLVMHYMAIHRPQIVIVEAGNSFNLEMMYLEKHGLETYDIVLKPGCGASLPPFADAMKLLDKNGQLLQASQKKAENDAELDQSTRDHLGEMLKKAELMITGGDPKEPYDRQDQALIKDALLETAIKQFSTTKAVTVSDLIATLNEKSKNNTSTDQSDRLKAMATAMSLFETGFEGELFNQASAGSDWNYEADVIRVEMGTLAGGDYKDKLALAYIGIINNAINMAENAQRSGRPIILLTDEGHAISTNPITAAYKTLIAKLSGRRMALWQWDATQNMEDYPDDAAKMLNMFEWWMLMSVDASELQHVERFKPLSPDQKSVALGCIKQPGAYAEGMILADIMEGQYRNSPATLPLALAQTEQHEKTARARIMEEHNCDELEAAEIIAQRMRDQRMGAT